MPKTLPVQEKEVSIIFRGSVLQVMPVDHRAGGVHVHREESRVRRPFAVHPEKPSKGGGARRDLKKMAGTKRKCGQMA